MDKPGDAGAGAEGGRQAPLEDTAWQAQHLLMSPQRPPGQGTDDDDAVPLACLNRIFILCVCTKPVPRFLYVFNQHGKLWKLDRKITKRFFFLRVLWNQDRSSLFQPTRQIVETE